MVPLGGVQSLLRRVASSKCNPSSTPKAFDVLDPASSDCSVEGPSLVDAFSPFLLACLVDGSRLDLVTLPARVMFPCSLLFAVDLVRLFCALVGFLAALLFESIDTGSRAPKTLDAGSLTTFLTLGRDCGEAFFSLTFKLAGVVFFCVFFFFFAPSGTLGGGKYRDREGS